MSRTTEGKISSRLEQVQTNMAGIQNSIRSSIHTDHPNTILRLRRQLEERGGTAKKARGERGGTVKRRTVEQEIRHLKTFLSDKISSINQMREELKFQDIDSNTVDGVKNVNNLGKRD